MSRYIYFVGKPYPIKDALEKVRKQGYKIGLFLDINTTVRNRNSYDNIVEVNYSSSQAIKDSLRGKKLTVNGLICTYENYILAKSHLANYFNLPAQSLSSAQMSTDKYIMRQAFKQVDPNITPEFKLVSNEQEALEAGRSLGFPLILKPTNLVKSLLVLRCNNESELRQNFFLAQSKINHLYKKHKVYERQPRFILEQYIKGKSCSIAAFVDRTGKPYFCEGIAALTNAQDLGINDNYLYKRLLPADYNEKLKNDLFNVAAKGVRALKMTSCPAHVELIYNNEGVKIIEIGARIGGYRPRMYELSYGLDLIAQEIKLSIGQEPNLSGNFQNYCAVYELFPKKEGKFVDIKGRVNTAGLNYYSVKPKVGDLVGPAQNGYKAVAVAMVANPDKINFNQICNLVEKLEVKIR